MKTAEPRLSVVIPVHNESARILRCLNALAAQSLKPFEVIVVDNNCSDDTIAKVKGFKKLKCRVVKEKVQGITAARNTGFNAAKGDIICRVDADTFLTKDWLKTADRLFKEDPKLNALSGLLEFYDAPLPGFSSGLFKFSAYFINYLILRQPVLHGGSMAIRRQAWQKVSGETCEGRGLAEDTDLALHLSDNRLKLIVSKELLAEASARRFKVKAVNYYKHLLPWTRVLRRHGMGNIMYGFLLFVVFPLATLAFRPIRWALLGFDPRTRRFTLGRLFKGDSTDDRVIPS